MTEIDLTTPRRIHVIGVGGAGMRAIASVLNAMGHQVSGTDLKASPGLDRLAAEGIAVTVGHEAAAIDGADLVTRSTAVPDTNPEVRAARDAGIPVTSRAEILTAITRVRRTVAVAGTHGKTTTSSMLAVVMREASLSPSFIIGGEVNEIGSGAVWSEDDGWFVVEADESDGTFLELASSAAIVTSVEPDHLGHYGGEAELVASFGRFTDAIDGPVVVCADDEGAAALAGRSHVVSYGTTADADWRIFDYRSTRTGASYRLTDPDGAEHDFTLATPGLHNVRNAAAATVMAVQFGAGIEPAQRALGRFGGVARRFQVRGERDGVTYIDDYAHLPTEVEAALEAATAGEWDRIVCVFQPHRYTRTSDLWQDFATSFGAADKLVVTGIYAAGEAAIPGVTAGLVVDAVTGADPTADVQLIEHRDDLLVYLQATLMPGDLCLTLGAGDLTTVPDDLLLP